MQKRGYITDNKLYSYKNQQITKQSNEINNNKKQYYLAKKHKSGNVVGIVTTMQNLQKYILIFCLHIPVISFKLEKDVSI